MSSEFWWLPEGFFRLSVVLTCKKPNRILFVKDSISRGDVTSSVANASFDSRFWCIHGTRAARNPESPNRCQGPKCSPSNSLYDRIRWIDFFHLVISTRDESSLRQAPDVFKGTSFRSSPDHKNNLVVASSSYRAIKTDMEDITTRWCCFRYHLSRSSRFSLGWRNGLWGNISRPSVLPTAHQEPSTTIFSLTHFAPIAHLEKYYCRNHGEFFLFLIDDGALHQAKAMTMIISNVIDVKEGWKSRFFPPPRGGVGCHFGVPCAPRFPLTVLLNT